MKFWIGRRYLGEIDRVDRTAIVTRFITLFHLPVFPLYSAYLSRRTKIGGVGMGLYSYGESEMKEFKIYRRDRKSILAAFLRLPLMVLALALLFSMLGEGEDGAWFGFAAWKTTAHVLCAAGIAASYLLGTVKDPEDQAIRLIALKYLGIAVDPVIMAPKDVHALEKHIDSKLESLRQDGEANPGKGNPDALGLELLKLRCGMSAEPEDLEEYESRSKSMLEEMRGKSAV